MKKPSKPNPSVSPLYCDHANEMPAACPCPEDCYCKSHSCKKKPKPIVSDHSDCDCYNCRCREDLKNDIARLRSMKKKPTPAKLPTQADVDAAATYEREEREIRRLLEPAIRVLVVTIMGMVKDAKHKDEAILAANKRAEPPVSIPSPLSATGNPGEWTTYNEKMKRKANKRATPPNGVRLTHEPGKGPVVKRAGRKG